MKHSQFPNSFKHFLSNIRFLIVVAGIALGVATYQIGWVGKYAIPSLYFIIKNPHLSYEEKIEIKRGVWAHLAEFAKKNTPPTSIIIYSPYRRNWEYFLYPRKLLSGSKRRPTVSELATHVLVIDNWPKFPLNARKFLHISSTRIIFVDGLGVGSSSSIIDSGFSQKDGFLENYLSNSKKTVNHYQRIKLGDHLGELIQVNYTFNNYDYWMRAVNLPLNEKTLVKARIKANINHIVNLVAEVSYSNGELAIFNSSPNKEINVWEVLSIINLYQMAKEYALARDWPFDKMQITKIGVNTGFPRQMPYQEKYGVIEIEKGQQGIEENADPKIDNAPYFFKMANYYKAKNQFEKATKYYQLSEKLNPKNAWTHCNLGDIYLKMNEYTKAMKEYKKAIQLEPDIAWFYFILGKVYEKEGEINLAKKNYQKALKIDSSGIWADYALKNLDKGKE